MIAAVNGHAIGIGFTITLQCDLRFMARDAKYGIVQVRRGVMPDGSSTWTLPRIVGMAKAADIMLTGRTFTGDEAESLGVASRVLPNDDVLPARPRGRPRHRGQHRAGVGGGHQAADVVVVRAQPRRRSAKAESDLHVHIMGRPTPAKA